MATTLKQSRDLIRSFYGLSSEEFTDTLLNQWINDGQRNVQLDLIKSGLGRENFIKTTSLSFTVKAITSASVTSKVATVTAASHGLAAGDYIIIQDLGTPFTALNGEWVVAGVSGNDFTFSINTADIAGAGQSAGWVTKGFASAPSDLMSTPDAILNLDCKFTTNAAVGGNDIYFKPVSEKLAEHGRLTDPVKTNANSYETPTSTQPYFWVEGNSSITKVIHIRPANIDVARITYYALGATLSADSDNIIIPDEYRDLVRLYVKRWVKEKQEQFDKVESAKIEYQNELKKLLTEYRQSKENKQIEKLETETK